MPTLASAAAYVGVEAMRRAGSIVGSDRDALLLEHLLDASRDVERLLQRCFFPILSTDYYRWPALFGQPFPSWELWLEQDALSVSSVVAAASGLDTIPVPLTHYWLEPQQYGAPYSRLEIDLSTADVFQSGTTPQRSIAVTGLWGYCQDTTPAGTLAADITGADVTLTVSNAALVDQGDLLLLGTEAIAVGSPRTQVATGATLAGGLAGSMTAATATLSAGGGALCNVQEPLLIDAETVLVLAIVGDVLTVQRAYDGSALASHSGGPALSAARGLTVVRGVNGTTAAAATSGAALAKYQAPANIRRLVRAEALSANQQDLAAWGRTVGAGDMAVQWTGPALTNLRDRVCAEYQRGPKVGAV